MTAPVQGQRRTAVHRGYKPCPNCDRIPCTATEARNQALDLKTVWLVETPAPSPRDDSVPDARPHGTTATCEIICRGCKDGPILTGSLAEQVRGDELPAPVATVLKANRWRPARDGDGWVCLYCQAKG